MSESRDKVPAARGVRMNDITLVEKTLRPAVTQQAGALAGSTALVVLGMHRSGTSALAGMLHHLGVALGERLMPASPDNPRGYWEHSEIVDSDQRLMASLGWAWDDIRPLPAGFEREAAAQAAKRELIAVLRRDFAGVPLWGLKDPRLCRLMPLWTALFAEEMVEPLYLLALRHPLDVVASLGAHPVAGAERAGLLWLGHVLAAERATRGKRRAIVQYEDLVAQDGWRGVASRIAGESGIAWPNPEAAAVGSFLDPELRRRRVSDADGAAAGRLPVWIADVYRAFRAGESQLGEICDAVGRQLASAGELFLPILGEMGGKLGEAAAGRQAQERALLELTHHVNRARHETGELRDRLRRVADEAAAQRQAAVALSPAGTRLPPPLGIDEAFPRWIMARGSTAAARLDWVAERVGEWDFTPVLGLGMILPAGSEKLLELTLRSLDGQIAGDWLLHVVCENGRPESLPADSRVVWHRVPAGGDAGPAEEATRRLAASPAHWVALIDAGDQLAPRALFAVADAFFRHPEWQALYTDEARIDPHGVLSGPHFKPDLNLEMLRGLPYVGALLAVRREVFAAIGGFDPAWDGTEEYDLALRLAERAGEGGFGHVADILYHRLTISGRSRRPAAAICADMPRIVQAHLDRQGIAAAAEQGVPAHTCRVRSRHDGPDPLVSIVVPSKNQLALLTRCVESVLQRTDYENYEVIVVDNGRDEPDACAYLQAIEDH